MPSFHSAAKMADKGCSECSKLKPKLNLAFWGKMHKFYKEYDTENASDIFYKGIYNKEAIGLRAQLSM